jgi:hypothetical protein
MGRNMFGPFGETGTRNGAVDELVLDVVPVLLGNGERLFDGVEDPGFEPIEVIPPLARRTSDTTSAAASAVTRAPLSAISPDPREASPTCPRATFSDPSGPNLQTRGPRTEEDTVT